MKSALARDMEALGAVLSDPDAPKSRPPTGDQRWKWYGWRPQGWEQARLDMRQPNPAKEQAAVDKRARRQYRNVWNMR